MTEIDKAYNNLASAIVLLTIEDFLKERITNRQFERYMRSSWFGLLVDIDPELLIKTVYKIKRNSYKKNKFYKKVKEFDE